MVDEVMLDDDCGCHCSADCSCNNFQRMPGLFRAWEVSQMLTHDTTYRIEPQGELESGEKVFGIWVEVMKNEKAPTP